MDGSRALETTVCPGRLLVEETWCEELIDWWMLSARWIGGGLAAPVPCGVVEWPFPGGVRRQPNRLVQAVKLLQSEWSRLRDDAPPKPAPQE